MNWAQNLLDDEAVFPNKIGSIIIYLPLATSSSILLLGVAFPRNFRDTVKTIVRRLFRVYAHIYSNHFDHICALGIEGVFHILMDIINPFLTLIVYLAHLNTSYRHFFLFINEVGYYLVVHVHTHNQYQICSLILLIGKNWLH